MNYDLKNILNKEFNKISEQIITLKNQELIISFKTTYYVLSTFKKEINERLEYIL